MVFFEGVSLATLGVAALYAAFELITGIPTKATIDSDGTVNGHQIVFNNDDQQQSTNNIKITGVTNNTGNSCWCGHPCFATNCFCQCSCGCSGKTQIKNKDIFNPFYNPQQNNENNRSTQQPVTFTTNAIEEGVKYATTTNKIKHIFKNPMHKLKPLVDQLGGHANAARAILIELSGKAIEGEVFEDLPLKVFGHTVLVRGIIINGIPKVGTFFIK
ncbi:MAG: hypothetical protein WA432_00630 [Candidatus Babeliaceae bacterium]